MEAAVLVLGVLIGIPLMLLAVLLPIAVLAERDRKRRLHEWAKANGWTFQERSSAPWTTRLPGRNRRGLGVTLTGIVNGRWVTVAEYRYETTSSTGESTTAKTHRYIAVLVLLDRAHPSLAVRERGMMSQFGRALFGDKPTATGNVMFDARFRIDAADAGYAKAMVGPHLVAAHIAGAVPQWSLVGNELLGFTPAGKLKDPNLIPWYAGQLSRVADLLGPVDFAAGPGPR
ncbi:hypothetical protein [Nocardia aurantiaca]|uniref:DUF3137 domain-containing protein n=1 Tax=Nocardia aurantiaca TaxID=2675850 RepID=A0A6I3KSI3_9NOCA|nr:hypothetical protein [Nocardia aurantiaca]MTE12477.1 hypothetical protein [Nocardia aurantiaca]